MRTMDTTILRTRKRCSLELLAIASDPDSDEDTLDPDEEIEIEVEITYEPGWFTPGKFSGPPESCYPDEGEDPEITKVVTLDEEGVEHDILGDLTDDEIASLTTELIEEQAQYDQLRHEADADEAYEAWREEQMFNDYNY